MRQQGTSTTIDPGNTRLLYACWQDGHLSTGQDLACPAVHAACVAYTEVDVTQYPDMSVVNDFVLPASDSVDRLYPAADPNVAGDKAMAFSASGPNRFAGTSFVLIPRSSTCTNCFNSETATAPGLGPYGGSGKQRWGDSFVLVGDAGDDGAPACAGNTLNGTTTIFASRGQAEVGGNTISEDLILNDSSGTGPDEESTRSGIETNTIGGDLCCTGNTPAPTNDGHRNSITGQGFGQCIGF